MTDKYDDRVKDSVRAWYFYPLYFFQRAQVLASVDWDNWDVFEDGERVTNPKRRSNIIYSHIKFWEDFDRRMKDAFRPRP